MPFKKKTALAFHPAHWLMEPLNRFVNEVMIQSGKRIQLIGVGKDLGDGLGLSPHESMEVATPVGLVTIYCGDK